jgi:hypothetical protein
MGRDSLYLLAAGGLAGVLSAGCADGFVFNDHGLRPHGHVVASYLYATAGATSIAPWRLTVPHWEPDPEADEAELALASTTPVDARSVEHRPPRVTPPEPVHHPFDGRAALSRLHATDFAPCTAPGAPETRTHGHAQVTFAPSGVVSGVLIDSPPGLSSDAVACVGDRLGQVAVPGFDGSAMKVGVGFELR